MDTLKTPASKTMTTWGDLNIALNGLVKGGVIVSYKTSRADKGGEAAIEVSTAKGADQAEVVRQVRELLNGAFAAAVVRTKAG